MSHEEEDTCVSCEEEDTSVSYEEITASALHRVLKCQYICFYCLCIRGGGYMRRKIHVSQMPVHTAFVYEEEDI